MEKKKEGKKKSGDTSLTSKLLSLLAAQNILIAIFDKILLVYDGAYGAPLILTAICWVLILKRKWYGVVAYFVLTGIITLFSLAALYCVFSYIYYEKDPSFGVIQTILWLNYLFTSLILRNFSEDF